MTSSLPPDTLLDPEEFEPAAETPSATGSPWRRHWYPVAHLHDLDPLRPTPFTLLGQDLVLWWDRQAEQWRAFADVCPHRLVPLSEGRLNEAGELECPYHGWTFQGDGHCSAIPQAPADGNDSRLRSPRSRCRSFATAAAQGLLFVFAGIPQEAGSVALPLVDPLVEKGNGWADGWVVQDTFRDLPMDALTVLENVRLAVQAARPGAHLRGLNLWSIWSDHAALTQRALAILQSVTMTAQQDAPVASLPHGERICFAVCVSGVPNSAHLAA